MKTYKILFLVFIALQAWACPLEFPDATPAKKDTTTARTADPGEDVPPVDDIPLAVYGNFCEPYDYDSEADVEPLDDLDACCFNHLIFYGMLMETPGEVCQDNDQGSYDMIFAQCLAELPADVTAWRDAPVDVLKAMTYLEEQLILYQECLP